MNGTPLPWKFINKHIGRGKSELTRSTSRNRLQMIDGANILDEVLALTLASIGTWVGGLVGLKLRNLIPIEKFKIVVYPVLYFLQP